MENSIEEDMKILEEFKTHGYAMLLIKYEDRNKTNLKLDQAIETVLSELEKKEAIINEMAKTINKEYYKDIIENYTKKVEKEGIKE